MLWVLLYLAWWWLQVFHISIVPLLCWNMFPPFLVSSGFLVIKGYLDFLVYQNICFKVCSQDYLNFTGICCDVSFFSSNFFLGVFSFIWLVHLRICQYFLSFQRTNSSFHWFFLFAFVLLISKPDLNYFFIATAFEFGLFLFFQDPKINY